MMSELHAIYTIGTDDAAYRIHANRAIWLDISCANPLSDLDKLDSLLTMRSVAAVGIRCTCHEWWNCGRSQAADYLSFVTGSQVRHLGEIIWDHDRYMSGHLEKRYTEEQLAAWTARRNRR
jgi:hypothetical protein